MKKYFALFLSLCLLVAMIGGCGGSSGSPSSGGSGGSIELKMNVTPAETSVWMVAAEEFKRIVEEETEGRYTVSIFANEQLSGGDLQKGVEMLFTGVTDVDIHSVINMTGFDERLTVVTMPWLFTDGYDSVDEYLFNGEGGDLLREIIKDKGAEVVGIGENGFRQITNNVRPINSVDDMKQLKIRTPPINMYVELYKIFGADPTAMSFSEVFTALQQGTIDGQENPLDTIRSAKIQEVQKYMTVWNYSYDPIMISVSNKVWDTLSEEDKEIFKRAGEQAAAKQVAAARAMENDIRAEFEEYMEINDLTPEQVAEFQAAAAPIYEQYRDVIGEDLFAAFGYTFS